MQITNFSPVVITEDAESAIALFEELGFERRHRKEGVNINDKGVNIVNMKHPDGFRVDVTKVERMPKDPMAIRMNVRDFDEAYEFLTSRGFTNVQGSDVTKTGSSRVTPMVSPSGFTIILIEHIK